MTQASAFAAIQSSVCWLRPVTPMGMRPYLGFGSRSAGPEDEEDLTVGLPPATDLEAASDDWLLEAELVAISEGDPETAALIAEELALRGRRSGPP